MPPDTRQDLFAVTSPGLEQVVVRELKTLGIAAGKVHRGGVDFRATLPEVARCNLWLRTATRIMLRLGAFDAPGRRELAARAARLPIDAYVPQGVGIQIQASSAKSRLYHTGLIAEVLHETLGRPETKEENPPILFVRFERDRCTVSIDTTGVLLHKRGYREESSHAPLRETLAAGLLLLSGYDGSAPFLDPMCGSGTIAIEAALIAMHRAPGLERAFAVEQFPSFDIDVMKKIREEARGSERAPPSSIFASDKHAGALAAAQRNAGRAGVTIAFERADAAIRSAPATTGLVLANPPYGKRIGGPEDDSLPALVRAIDGAFSAWRVGALLPQAVRVNTRRKITAEHKLDNGGIPVKLVEWAA
jgi:putative N6-adenine-specific DNA methylase